MFEKYISSFPTVRPPAGSPAANSSFKPSEISDTIDFSRGLPGFTVGNKSHYQIANASGTIEFIIENLFFSEHVYSFSGTKYDFWLYYSNTTISDWLTWTGKKALYFFWTKMHLKESEVLLCSIFFVPLLKGLVIEPTSQQVI